MKVTEMYVEKIADDFFIAGQVHVHHLESIVAQGFRGIICTRPDGEELGQPNFEIIQTAAKAVGLEIHHVPIAPNAAGLSDVAAFQEALKCLPGPILGYCRTGKRAAALYSAVGATAR